MTKRMTNCLLRAATIGTVFALAFGPMPHASAHDGNPNPGVLPPNANAFGKSYAQWSAAWWRWHLRLPATDHPAFDITGENCGDGQSGKVWFLTGAFTSEFPINEFNTIIREDCRVPSGKAIFFPIINVECSTIEADPYMLVPGKNGNAGICAKKFFDGRAAVVKDLSAKIDGTSLTNLEAYRFQSPVFRFEFDDPEDNILGVDCHLVDCIEPKSVSDGYWILLPPLSRGSHTIQFTGSFRDPASDELFFGLDVKYELTVGRDR